MPRRQRGRQRTVLLFVSALLVLSLTPDRVRAQDADGWWARVAVEAGNEDHDRRHRRRHSRAPGHLHIPRGHLPPPGACRLWYPGEPPGQQPPPVSCEKAIHRQRAAAVVVTHDGSVYRASRRLRPRTHWHRRRAGDLDFRRGSERRQHLTISVEILVDLLGRDGYRRLAAQRRRAGVRGELVGRWVSAGRSEGRVLQVRAGRHPLAELADWNGDGRVDVMLVRRPR